MQATKLLEMTQVWLLPNRMTGGYVLRLARLPGPGAGLLPSTSVGRGWGSTLSRCLLNLQGNTQGFHTLPEPGASSVGPSNRSLQFNSDNCICRGWEILWSRKWQYLHSSILSWRIPWIEGPQSRTWLSTHRSPGWGPYGRALFPAGAWLHCPWEGRVSKPPRLLPTQNNRNHRPKGDDKGLCYWVALYLHWDPGKYSDKGRIWGTWSIHLFNKYLLNTCSVLSGIQVLEISSGAIVALPLQSL